MRRSCSSGTLDEADDGPAGGGPAQPSHRRARPARRWRCSVGPRSRCTAADADAAGVLLDEALAVARESDVGFHLLDRIYGTRITAAADPAAALAMLDEAELGVRGPLETCPGCRITLAVPAAIAAARAGDLDRAARVRAQATETLAAVVMRLPAWDAALEEVRGHLALAEGTAAAPRPASARRPTGFRDAGQPLDEARCAALAEARA